jgi:hypothetical protein
VEDRSYSSEVVRVNLRGDTERGSEPCRYLAIGCSGRQSSQCKGHKAEVGLSGMFEGQEGGQCDWSGLTTGKKWETWSERNKDLQAMSRL